MQSKRPTSVLVIAIFHFVFGTFGVMGSLFNVAATAITMANPGLGAAGGPSSDMAAAQNQYLDAHAPGWKEISLAFAVVDLFISVLIIVAGVGLLKMRPWGRSLSLIYGGVTVLFQIGRIVYSIVFFLPVLGAFYESFLASSPPGPQTQVLALMKPLLFVASYLGLLGLIYPVIVVFIMLRPSVAAAFRGESTGPDDEAGRDNRGGDRLPPGYGEAPPGYGGEPDDRFGAAPQ